jgi:hypothetical protein
MTFLDVLGVGALLVLGFFLGYWRGQSRQGRRVLDYWLTATDGRVNWTRATAAVGLGSFLILQAAFIHIYVEMNGADLTEELLVMVAGSLGIAGINLGQYWVSRKGPPPPAAPATPRVSGEVSREP